MNKKLIDSVLVFVAGSSYGFIVPVIKSAAEVGIYPATFLPMQYLVAFVACVAVLLVRRVHVGPVRKLLPLAVLGLFTGGTSISYYTAVTLLPSAAALTLLFQYVWISVLIECIHRRKLPAPSSVVAIIVVFAGTLFATGLFDGTAVGLDPMGVAFGVASAVFYALFLYFSGILGTDQPTLVRTTMLALGGLALTSVVSPAAYTTAFVEPATWPYGIALAVMGILFPTSLINYASPRLSAGMVSIMASSELPVGIVASWLIVGDQPTPFVLFGAALVFVGILCKQIPDLLAERNRVSTT